MMKTETIKTTDGVVLQAIPMRDGTVTLAYGDTGIIPLDARNCNQLARALRNAALQVESEEQQKR